MKKLLFILALLIPEILSGQAVISWIQDTRGNSITLDNSNNVYTIDNANTPGGDIILTKRDANGNLLWQSSYNQTDTTKWEKAVWVTSDNLGNAIVAGTLMSSASNVSGITTVVMKFDPLGNLLWRYLYTNAAGSNSAKKCISDAVNNVYVLTTVTGGVNTAMTNIRKFSPEGVVLWSYNNSSIGSAVNFKFTPDNSIVISGRGLSVTTSGGNGYAKIDLNGVQIWSIAGVNSVAAGDAAGDAFGNTYTISSQGISVVPGSVLRKLNPSGVQIWQKGVNLFGQRIEVGTDNLPVASGFPLSNTTGGSAFVKVDANGNILWLNSNADGSYNLTIHSQIVMDSQNNTYLAGGTQTEMAVCKVNSNGASGWTVAINASSAASGLAIGSDNGIYITGGKTAKIKQLNSCPIPQNLYTNEITPHTAKLNWDFVTGALKYEIHYRTALSPSIVRNWNRRIVSGDSNYLVLTQLKCNTPYNWRIRAICDTLSPVSNVSFSAIQSFVTGGCSYNDKSETTLESDNITPEIPLHMYLSSNYPNPFNPATVINFGLNEDSRVKIEIFNVLGKRVSVLEDSYKTKGNYRIDWKGTDYNGVPQSSGIYFYKMSAGDFIAVRKMILSR